MSVGETDDGRKPIAHWRTIMLVVTAVLGAVVLVALILTLKAADRQRDRALDLQSKSYEVMILASNLSGMMADAEASLGRYVISTDKQLGQLYSDQWLRAGGLLDQLDRSTRVTNMIVTALSRLGISAFGAKELVVIGRRSGRPHSTPVNPLQVDGSLYLVAPRGQTQWVRNVRHDPRITLRSGRAETAYRAKEVHGAAAVPVVPAVPVPAEITTMTAAGYRNPALLPPGEVLVVGASASGIQIADELRRSGRPVTWSWRRDAGRSGRATSW